jgi:glycosyltransferase involved in cell wall biosynthesis
VVQSANPRNPPSPNLLVIATTFPRRLDDTLPRFVFDLALHMQRLGDRIHVLAPHAAGAAEKEDLGGISVRRFRYFRSDHPRALAYGGGILNNVRTSPVARSQILSFTFRLMRETKRMAQETEASAIHSHWVIPCGVAAAHVVGRRGLRHVATMHAGDVAGLLKLPGKGRVAHYVLARTAHVVAVSNFVADRFLTCVAPRDRADAREKVIVLPMGVDVADLSAGPVAAMEPRSLLFVGRLVEKKGIHVLLSAVARLKDEFPDVRLLVCGTGPLRPALEDQVQRLGLGSNVEFKGFVKEEEKRALLRAKPLVIVPSIESEGGDFEGLPVAVLEGLAAGCLVVASRAGGVTDVLRDGENGLLVESGDVDGLASAIRRGLRDEGLGIGLGRRAQADSAAFDWPVIAAAYQRLLFS